MSGSSCDCRVTYQLPTSSEEPEESSQGEISALEEVPKPTPPGLKEFFLSNEDIKDLKFEETLLLRKKGSRKVVGRGDMMMERAGQERVLVCLRGIHPSRGKVDEVKVFTLLGLEIDTEEQLVETQTVSDRVATLLRQHLLSDGGNLKMVLEEEGTGRKSVKREETVEDRKSLLTEGGCLLFLRQIARKDFTGRRYFKTLLEDGQIAETEFKCYPFELVRFGDKIWKVKRVRRRMMRGDGPLEETNSYLSEEGKFLLITWKGEDYIAVIEQKGILEELRAEPILRTILEEESQKQVLLGHNYLRDHPQSKDLLSFIAKTLLLYKPHKVVHFVRRNIAPYI